MVLNAGPGPSILERATNVRSGVMTQDIPLGPASIVRQCSQTLGVEADGEVLLMNLAADSYFGLDPIGSDIWRQLDRPTRIDALCTRLEEAYAASPGQVKRDLLALLERMRTRGLIEVQS